jgi:hypothetical protein
MAITLDRPASPVTNPRELISPALFFRLVSRIADEESVSREYAERIMDQALAFLAACALNPDAGLAPSETVDVGWHTFLLYTREYAAFCEQVAGRFIHHTPDDEAGAPRVDDDTAGGAAQAKTMTIGVTVNAMRAAGLPVDIDLWIRAGDCSQCHAGCHDSPRGGVTWPSHNGATSPTRRARP